MGFNSVYKALQDIFPEVDSRALRAVAIEHPNDVAMAVEVALVDVIPYLPEKARSVGSSSGSKSSLSFFEGDGGETTQPGSTVDHLVIDSNRHEQSTGTLFVSSPDASSLVATEDTNDSAQPNSHTVTEPVPLESPATSSYLDAFDENAIEFSSGIIEPLGDSSNINHDSGSSDNHGRDCVNVGCENVENGTLFVPISNHIVGSFEEDMVATEQSDPSSSKSASEKDVLAVQFNASDDEPVKSPVLASSEGKCSTDILEEIIEDAKNNKQTLVLAMNSVVDLMREVESKEKAAEEAKEYATQGCSDILAKAEEVKQALLRAKETNDMHAGEVNAERAILSTELKELQLRLLNLSDERNRSLAILEEMRKALEIRLAAALDEIAKAEEQKLENERAAREALLYQESQMEKVVEESKRLKLVAEENSKLQEFLTERGRAIDILQGEISVKCQDVLLLKEKFDKGILLTRSLSSSQTSSILASSGSSFKSVIKPLEPEPELETFESLMKSTEMGDSYGFVDKSFRSDVAPEETASLGGDRDRKMLMEDGWELFDKLSL